MIYSRFDEVAMTYSKKITKELSPHKDEPVIQISYRSKFMRIDRRPPLLWPDNFKESEIEWSDVPLVIEPQPKIASNEWAQRLLTSYEPNQTIDKP